MSAPDGEWIFGYGSLVWRPDFEFLERAPARLHGWARRFWQGSPDHRGRPDAPGRVVTLIPDEQAVCWGIAYRVGTADLERVLRRLDHREQGGYTQHRVPLELDDGRRIVGLVYVATPGNAHFLGPAPLEQIAAEVRAASGPSGHNTEYVLELARALTAIGGTDAHVDALATLLTGSDHR